MEEIKTLAIAKIEVFLNRLPDEAAAYHGYLIETFGETITLSLYLAAAALALLAAFRGLKFSFDVLRFVAVPTFAVAFIGSLLTSFSFLQVAPLAAIVFASLLLLKG